MSASYFPSSQLLLAARREPKLLVENFDVKIKCYMEQIAEEWPLPRGYWFGTTSTPLDDLMAEADYEWQMCKREYDL
jgi:hypothetical protein